MKISIRSSMFIILLTLVMVAALTIAAINYLVIHNILVVSAKNSLQQISNRVSEQVASYLTPLQRRPHLAARLIGQNIIQPAANTPFAAFLYSIISYDAGISTAFWADRNGDWYLVKKARDNTILNQNIIHNTSTLLVNRYDHRMNLIASNSTKINLIDPRNYPWYQEAIAKKNYVLLIYPLPHLHHNYGDFGITSVYPVYDNKNELLGVFGLDLPLAAITSYIKTIQITPSSVIFICDHNGNVISAYSSKFSIHASNKPLKLTDLQLPWVTTSYNNYLQNKQSLFSYIFAHNKYISSYTEIHGINEEGLWQIAVVTPLSDFTQPLQKELLLTVIVIVIVITLSVLLAIFFSASIGKPIVQLAEETKLICQLKLIKIRPLYSRIKEIAYMAEAFLQLKTAMNSFQRYMPTSLVRALIASESVAEVGGELKELTIMFSDIENFTTIAESMPPPDVMHYLSEYFQIITKVVTDNHGTVDKYIGDSAMVFWGAPTLDSEHAYHACTAALQLQTALQQLNAQWCARNKPMIATRIGISTGNVIVGNVGSDDRLSYTVLGDAVNVSSRLENLNKIYGTKIIVADTTYKLVKDHFRFKFIDKATVKGRKQSICVYELLG